jgi:hypothetical protein
MAAILGRKTNTVIRQYTRAADSVRKCMKRKGYQFPLNITPTHDSRGENQANQYN